MRLTIHQQFKQTGDWAVDTNKKFKQRDITVDTNQQFNPFNGLAEDRSGIKFVAAGINYHQNKARRPKSRITEQLQGLPWRNAKEKLLRCITM